jgi:hypothetical protein
LSAGKPEEIFIYDYKNFSHSTDSSTLCRVREAEAPVFILQTFRFTVFIYNGFALRRLSVDIGCGTITIPSCRLPVPAKTIFSPACNPLSTK